MEKNRSMQIYPVSKRLCRLLVLKHHYSGRVPGIKFCWGLLEGNKIVGCVIYSIPASYTLCKGVCGLEYSKQVLEFSRLVVTTSRKNAASFLIGNSLQELGRQGDWVVVSYADCNNPIGHIGYVYQATNWLYTGQGNAEPVWIHPDTGQVISYTRRHIDQKAKELGLGWSELVRRKRVGKHRYVIFVGNRRFKRRAQKALRYEVLPYPKGQTQRHSGCVIPVLNRRSNHEKASDTTGEPNSQGCA